ncbi:hypothetical protein SAMN06265182_0255 [Persephonella hydrogeniphila]|uniref:Uncharacterized protein n=1 Tax=Persephonella hydrogeniphila TaxID=198703 RepID=A0A285N0V9_9AQUI|nr:hypothetical protein [Persephonella hydrogeniphila]SNZ02968.1 hypothetical protein SAMN06265182_0255 [Persephonella hydrogeniphila]
MKALILLLLFIGISSAYEINYKWLKLDVVRMYPAKTSLYEKEPIFVRFDIFIKENRTGLQKEVLLSFIRMRPVDKKLISYQQERFIHPDEKKLKVKNVLYMKKGDTYFPFEIYFDTSMMKGILEEAVLKELSKKFVIEKRQPVYISPIPYKTPYVGSFQLKTELQEENGTATLYIYITGKGFPKIPNYTVAVKNGSAKKTGFDIKNDMGYIKSVQKYKIVYMDSLEVLPVRFTFFDPFQQKLVEKETKTIKITSPEKEKKIPLEELPEEKKIDFYLQKFKSLHPEYFEEKNLLEVSIKKIHQYRNHILSFILLTLIVAVVLSRRIFVKAVPEKIKEILSCKLLELNDFKKLFRFIQPNSRTEKEYFDAIDLLFFRSKIEKEGDFLKRLVAENASYSPSKIVKLFNRIKLSLIEEQLEHLSPKKKAVVKTYIFIESYFDILFITGFIIFLSLVLQIMINRFPQYSHILLILNTVVIIGGITGIFLFRKPLIRVKDD